MSRGSKLPTFRAYSGSAFSVTSAACPAPPLYILGTRISSPSFSEGLVMTRGEMYLVSDPAGDPRRQRVFVIVSHQGLIDSSFSTVICAPVYTHGAGLQTQVSVGIDEGLKHPSWIMCDNLVSIAKVQLTRYVGTVSPDKLHQLNRSLAFALDLPLEGN